MKRTNHFQLLTAHSLWKTTFIALLVVVLTGCGISYKTVMDSTMQSDKMTVEKSYNTITSILVDNGFDIKMGNKDMGIISTEYKKFGAIGGDPPFDLYLQIKMRIKEVPNSNKIQIVSNPIVKTANRLNAAAFEEEPVRFFDEETQKRYMSSDDKVRLKGYLMYYNVMQKVAETLGLGVEDIKQTLEQREKPMF